jgi:hypothetical protein
MRPLIVAISTVVLVNAITMGVIERAAGRHAALRRRAGHATCGAALRWRAVSSR